MRRFVLLLAFLAFGVAASNAQNVAIKSNLLYDATRTLNLGVEVGLHPRWTLDLSGDYNSWSRDAGVKWKHLFIQPEARYWFCDRFAGHFIGGHLIYGAYNFGNLNNNISFLGTDLSPLSKYRYQGERRLISATSISLPSSTQIGSLSQPGFSMPLPKVRTKV